MPGRGGACFGAPVKHHVNQWDRLPSHVVDRIGLAFKEALYEEVLLLPELRPGVGKDFYRMVPSDVAMMSGGPWRAWDSDFDKVLRSLYEVIERVLDLSRWCVGQKSLLAVLLRLRSYRDFWITRVHGLPMTVPYPGYERYERYWLGLVLSDVDTYLGSLIVPTRARGMRLLAGVCRSTPNMREGYNRPNGFRILAAHGAWAVGEQAELHHDFIPFSETLLARTVHRARLSMTPHPVHWSEKHDALLDQALDRHVHGDRSLAPSEQALWEDISSSRPSEQEHSTCDLRRLEVVMADFGGVSRGVVSESRLMSSLGTPATDVRVRDMAPKYHLDLPDLNIRQTLLGGQASLQSCKQLWATRKERCIHFTALRLSRDTWLTQRVHSSRVASTKSRALFCSLFPPSQWDSMLCY